MISWLKLDVILLSFYSSTRVSQGLGDSLGVSVAGGKGSPLGDIPIFIAMIQASGVAAKTHQLKVTETTPFPPESCTHQPCEEKNRLKPNFSLTVAVWVCRRGADFVTGPRCPPKAKVGSVLSIKAWFKGRRRLER